MMDSSFNGTMQPEENYYVNGNPNNGYLQNQIPPQIFDSQPLVQQASNQQFIHPLYQLNQQLPQTMTQNFGFPSTGSIVPNDPNHNEAELSLTKFASLLSSSRSEGQDEPVVQAANASVELAKCFVSTTYGQQGLGASPPSISSSSLAIRSRNDATSNDGANDSIDKSSLEDKTVVNMTSPFYTTPDTATLTPITILRNVVLSMEELMESRLRSTVLQLVSKTGCMTAPSTSGSHPRLTLKLLSPSRNPIRIATVVTRFVHPEDENADHIISNTNGVRAEVNGDVASMALLFKATLDVKIFGEVTTVELSTPVTLTGKFSRVGSSLLLGPVDLSFDCAQLLRSMISHARILVKSAVTKAAGLALQISEWCANSSESAPDNIAPLGGDGNSSGVNKTANSTSLKASAPSTLSLQSIFSNESFLDLEGISLESFFTSSSSLSNSLKKGGNNPLRSSRRKLLGDSLGNKGNLGKSSSNANETFDTAAIAASAFTPNVNSVVRFCEKSSELKTPSPPIMPTLSSFQQQTQQMPSVKEEQQEQQEQQQATSSNIHQGLFSWLENDNMFLSEEKIKEQDEIDRENERKRREAPMPLRFFTAAEEIGGGNQGLEIVSNALFGQGGSSNQNCNKRQKYSNS